MQQPWRLMRHKTGEEAEAIRDKVWHGTATEQEKARLAELDAAREANSKEQAALNEKLRTGTATAEDVTRLQELKAEWTEVEQSPPKDPAPIRQKAMEEQTAMLTHEPPFWPLERWFLEWQKEEARWAGYSLESKDRDGALAYEIEGQLLANREYFNDPENWKRLNPDTAEIEGLDYSDRQAIREFKEKKEREADEDANPPLRPQQGQTEYGMDMSRPGAAQRWKQILSWVKADLAPDNPEFGVCQVPATWKPRTKKECVEERFLRQLLLAKTADAIGRACCPAFLIKGLASPEDETKFGAVEIEEAFRLVAKSFNLTDAEAYQARQFADTLNDKNRAMWGADEATFTCAEKFNIIRQAVETAKLVADLSDRKALAESVAETALRKVVATTDAKSDAPASESAPGTATSAHCTVCSWTHDGGDMTSYRDGERRYMFKSTTTAFKLLDHVHAGMAKGQESVDCASFPNADNPYLGDLRGALKSKRNPDAHRVLLACVGNRRARIRKPEETRPKALSPKSPRARRKTG